MKRWNDLTTRLLDDGFFISKPFLSARECRDLRSLFENDQLFRSTIDMKRYNFGQGLYRYFKYPLPEPIQSLREQFYQNLVPAANAWSKRLGYEQVYPSAFAEFAKLMKEKGQTKSTPLMLHYKENDFNCLHQDISKDLCFPYQVVIGLSEKGGDYEGGQLILTQQRPRMQTIPYILTVPKGGAVIFASNFHPRQGSRGFYRCVFKHGVGRIEAGDRYTLGLVFHDYKD